VSQVVTQPSEIARRALEAIAEAGDAGALERLRVQFLGKSSELMAIPKMFGSLPAEEKASAGRAFNEARKAIEAALQERGDELERSRIDNLADQERIDITFPGTPPGTGRPHVLTAVQREIESVMESMGYRIDEGPEVETDWYNFEALNLPKGHASRDVQDTFFMNAAEDVVLRTHTSPVQIRAMERLKAPPIYVIVPGRVYRRDASDPSHTPTFMQLEGLAVDDGLTVGDLKGTLTYMCQSLFGPERRIRMRPHNFSYTEPSFEFDCSCGICGGAGCRSCGGDGWLEIGGCGMVHPSVLRNGGIDPERYSGYAWGFGIERMAALKYNVPDIRYFYENDVRFLETF
jgi:phenylalanyl-tRNA synthetase alpha chain